jgi:hypothetical protein
VPGNAAAIGQHYNAATDRYITFDGIVKALAEAAGVEAKIVYYDPKAVKLEKGQGIPFRTEHFIRPTTSWRMCQSWCRPTRTPDTWMPTWTSAWMTRSSQQLARTCLPWHERCQQQVQRCHHWMSARIVLNMSLVVIINFTYR